MGAGEVDAVEIAKAAGREAARETLMLIGIDASTPDGIKRAQRNYMFLDDLQSGVSAAKRKTFMALVGSAITAGIAYMILGLRGH